MPALKLFDAVDPRLLCPIRNAELRKTEGAETLGHGAAHSERFLGGYSNFHCGNV